MQPTSLPDSSYEHKFKGRLIVNIYLILSKRMISWAAAILFCTVWAILSLQQARNRRQESKLDHPSRPRTVPHGGITWSSRPVEDGDDIHTLDLEDGMAGNIQPEDGTIKSISLLGERNSGTRWIYGHLSQCFNHTIPVHHSLSRYKHWFQYDDPTAIPKHTLSIAMFRHPISWTWAMKEVPHHATEHIDLPWEEFVTKKWTMERMCNDLSYLEHQRKINNATGRICQENFHYHEIVSCLVQPCPDGQWATIYKHKYSRHQPFYEMRVNDPEGRPYANILKLRADKIRNFVESATYSNVDGFWHYQYESLLKTGTRDLVERIERATGKLRNPETCKIYEPQNRRLRPMDQDFFDYMMDHVDWNAEALVGYKKPPLHSNEIVELAESHGRGNRLGDLAESFRKYKRKTATKESLKAQSDPK